MKKIKQIKANNSNNGNGNYNKEKLIFTTTSLHHTTLVLICIRFTCPRCYSEGQEDGLAGGQRHTTVRKQHFLNAFWDVCSLSASLGHTG